MKRKKNSKADKLHWEMTAEEFSAATAQFDREIDLSTARPVSKAERQRMERARRRPVRFIQIKDRPTQPVTVQLDEELLHRTDEYAAAHGMTRDELINRSLKGILAFAE